MDADTWPNSLEGVVRCVASAEPSEAAEPGSAGSAVNPDQSLLLGLVAVRFSHCRGVRRLVRIWHHMAGRQKGVEKSRYYAICVKYRTRPLAATMMNMT